jgi:hypothetical protein
MIQITAYLRDEEDLAKWKAVKNKTELLHNALNNQQRIMNIVANSEIELKRLQLTPTPKPSKTPKNLCKQHQVDKSVCKNMKHGRK